MMSNYNKQKEYEKIQMSKLSYFCSVIGDNDFLKAERYLTESDWDEQVAVETYLLTHQNDIISDQAINKDQSQFKKQYQNKPQIPKNENININNYEKKNFLEFNINETIIKYSNESYPYSAYLKDISNKLNPIERIFNSFLKIIKYKVGIIIIFNDESFNRLVEQIKKINENNFNKEMTQNCIIYPILDKYPIGNEFVRKLSIVSFPTYIFCKYKDKNNIYITDKMEGAFEISFFIDSILLNISDRQNSQNFKFQNSSNYSQIKNNENKENKENKRENKNLINDLLNDFRKYHQEINNKNNKNKLNLNKNNNLIKELEDKRYIEPKLQKDEKINGGDYYLGDSMEIENLINNNNNFNKIDNNFNNKKNYENNFNNNDDNKYINNNESNNISDDYNNNILADSIYQLSDAQILAKREKEMKELERQQKEKEKKEEEEKRKILEEENRLKNINKKYEDEANLAKMILSEEPEENDPDACHIVFRVPDGEKNIERKFFKSDKIAVLYNYIKSIGREIFMEPDSTDFELLCIGFPPKNLEDKKNNTLEEEGLFPNSILQIREI